MKIAIVGAGLAGLTAANVLKSHADLTVFDKARGVGGRMCVRRTQGFTFHHGAQYFTAKSHAFQQFLKPMIDAGCVAPWQARIAAIDAHQMTAQTRWHDDPPHYVGLPAMNALAKHLSFGLTLQCACKITALNNKNPYWYLTDQHGGEHGPYDWVILTAPAPQTLELLPHSFSDYSAIASAKMHSCFALMLGFNHPLPTKFDAALITNSDIQWLAHPPCNNNGSARHALLVHSSHAWADDHVDDDTPSIITHLCQQTTKAIGFDVSNAPLTNLHRWRYAKPTHAIGSTNHRIDNDLQLGVCGDWLSEGRVEAAFTSGNDLAHALLKEMIQ